MAKNVVNTIGANGSVVSPTVFQRNLLSVAMGAAFGLAMGFFIILALIWRPLPGLPAVGGTIGDHVLGCLGMLVHRFLPFLCRDTDMAMRRHLAALAESGAMHLLYVRCALAGLGGSALGGLIAWAAAKPTNGLIHTRGRQLLEDKGASGMANSYLKKQAIAVGFDLKIHPEITFTLEQFTKHLLIMGAIGGGKTTVIMYLLNQINTRGDKALIFDVKGDYTAKYPGAALIAPWDERGRPWLIAIDCNTRQDAREFAIQVIPDSKDPMWAQAARQVLVGMIVFLQKTKRKRWGWLDLKNLFAVTEEELIDMMRAHNPEALRAVESANQTTTGILINMMAGLSWITDLADAWGNPTKEQGGISFIEWLFDEETADRQIILQGNGRFQQMMEGYVSAIISMLSARINSPEFSDSRTRKLWLILDEFPQIGKIKYQALIETGRSKGVRVVIGIQDINQVTKVYTKEDADALMSMVGTKIIAQIAPGETAKKVAELIGDREVERHNLSVSGSGSGKSTTAMMNREQIRVVYDSELSSELGNRPEKGGVVALMINNDAPYVYMLTWPHDKTPNQRKSYVEAAWVAGAMVDDEEAYALSAPEPQSFEDLPEDTREAGGDRAQKERARLAEEESEFRRAQASAATRTMSDLLAGPPKAEAERSNMGASMVSKSSVGMPEDGGAGGNAKYQHSSAMGRHHMERAQAQSDLTAGGADGQSLGLEAIEAARLGQAIGSEMGLGHAGQHAIGLVALMPTIADALASQAVAPDPIEIRRNQLAIERARGRGQLQRWAD